MNGSWMLVGAAGVGVETLVILTALGFGLCAVAMPRRLPRALLLAPVVGLGVALLANQWLTWFLPAPAALVVAVLGCGGLSVAQAWRERAALGAIATRRLLVATVAAIGLAGYLGNLWYLSQAGTFTLAGYPSDAVHLYAPAAEWFVAHGFRPGAPVPVTNPIVDYLDFATRAMPGSVGTLDAGLSVLTGWPVHALFDPLQSVLVSLTAIATAALVRVGAGFSRGAAVLAFAMLPASALLEWAVLSPYQQQLETMPLLFGGLALALLASREGGARLWMLAAVTLAALPGAYLPMTALAVVLVGPAAALAAVRRVAARRPPVDRGVMAGVVTGLVLAAPGAGWILFGGGLGLWVRLAQPHAGEGGVMAFYPLPYVVGIIPVTRFTMPGWPFGLWRPQWDRPAAAAAIALLALVALGVAVLVRHRRALEVAGVAGAIAYVGYLRLAGGPYELLKTMAYLTPVVAALAAIAVVAAPSLRRAAPSVPELVWPRALAASRKAALGLALAYVVVLQVAGNVDEQRLAVEMGPTMDAQATGLTVLRTLVPYGARVLVYDPHDWSRASLHIVWRYESATYALTGHANTHMVVEGPEPAGGDLYREWTPGAGPAATLRHAADRYEFVLTGPEVADQVPEPLRPVWLQADLGLELFRRVSPSPS